MRGSCGVMKSSRPYEFPFLTAFVLVGTFHPVSQSLDPLAAFPRVAGFERVPFRDAPGLHAQHVMIRIIRPQVRHGFGFGLPRVPYNNVGEHVPFDLISGFPALEDGDPLVGIGGIDSVGFGFDRYGFLGRWNLLPPWVWSMKDASSSPVTVMFEISYPRNTSVSPIPIRLSEAGRGFSHCTLVNLRQP